MSTRIEWADETWNPVTGCTPISEGCQNCYAKRMARRLAGRFGYPEVPDQFDVTLHPDKLNQPLKWRKPRRVFVCSMSDLYHESVNFEFIDEVFDVMRIANQHTFMILTKRPLRMAEYFQHDRRRKGIQLIKPSHIWLGVSAENQQRADERIPLLLQTPVAKRFVSVEPMVGPVDLKSYIGLLPTSLWPELDEAGSQCWLNERTWLDWVICGAETGPSKREMEKAWAINLRDQCRAAGVPFFFKRNLDGNHTLDGVLHEETPQ